MRSVIAGDFHLWDGASPIPGKCVLVSDEATKQLRSFSTWDKAITWLFMNDYRDEARHVNAYVKASKP